MEKPPVQLILPGKFGEMPEEITLTFKITTIEAAALWADSWRENSPAYEARNKVREQANNFFRSFPHSSEDKARLLKEFAEFMATAKKPLE